MSYKISSTTAEEKIKLAKDDSVDRLYERTNQRTIRVLTVCLYVLCVSLAAIILSCYYIFLWDPTGNYRKLNETQHKPCDKIIIPQQLAIRLANSTEVSAETFFRDFYERLEAELERSEMVARPTISKYLNFELNTTPVEYPKKKIEEILRRISKYNDYDDPKFKKKHQRSDRMRLGSKKPKIMKNFEDDEDHFEHSGNNNDNSIAITTNLPTTQDLNDTTIVFDDQEMEIVGSQNGS